MKKTVYFENLDSLRFFSFLAVFIYHIVNYLPFYPNSSLDYSILNYINKLGPLGVNFFFVLSGFLITYLLLVEKKSYQTINLKYFYLKRFLRIWPLYYFILILGFGVYPYISLGRIDTETLMNHLWKFVLFINNFDRIETDFAGINSDALGVMWTIGIEEQFYLVWPIIILLIKKEKLLTVFIFLIIVSIAFRTFYWDNPDVIYFHTLSVFSDLIVGSVIGYCIVYYHDFKLFIEGLSKRSLLIIYTTGIIFMYIFVNFSNHPLMIIFSRLFISLFFAFIILEQCFNSSSILKIGESSFIRKLGVISYGLYCLHLPVIGLLQKVNSIFSIELKSDIIFLTQTIIALIISIVVSYLSYRLFEEKILFLKDKWRPIQNPTKF